MRLSSQNPRDMKALIQRQEEELIHLREEVEFLKEGKKLVIWKHKEAAARIEQLEAAFNDMCGTAKRALEDAANHAARIEQLEKALREGVYEATHLSPENEDGSHWAKMSKAWLEQARAALGEKA